MSKKIKQKYRLRNKSSIRPGIKMGIYPQQQEVIENGLLTSLLGVVGAVQYRIPLKMLRWKRMIKQVDSYEKKLKRLSKDEFSQRLLLLKKQLNMYGMNDQLVMLAFAFIREASVRVLGMRHHNCQLIGGWIMLKGSLAEMETGEGKTLTAILPACTAALAGVPVHIITVNDYLVERDAQTMRQLYAVLGLSVGVIKEQMNLEQRQAAYACDIVYGSNKQIAFDYMRDRIAMGNKTGRMHLQLKRLYEDDKQQNKLMMRGLCFAIVDEADSVLIDEARTPLIISKQSQNLGMTQALYRQALLLAQSLKPDLDYKICQREISFTAKGLSDIESKAASMGALWQAKRRREELIHQALVSLHIFIRDKQYLVRDGKIHIIDEHTGRLMSDRNWEQGLHQLIETKEGCALSGHKETIARLTYQRFFRRYLHLAGMTGTAREVSGELKAVYGLNVIPVPTYKPTKRHWLGLNLFQNVETKWTAIIKRVQQLHLQGRPILVGTRSVQESEYLSRLMTKAGLAHRILNARQDHDEARIVAEGGKKGYITVATNMAGRGTDIPLHQGVANLGGLHVIATEYNEARRIDRQLFGRCARQGDPGSCEAIISLDDDLLKTHCPAWLYFWLRKNITHSKPGRGMAVRLALFLSQWKVERFYRQIRRDVLKTEEQVEQMLAFSGRPE